MNTRGGSKTGLFLIELVIVILFFSVSATICMRIFAFSYTAANHSRDLSDATAAAAATAECFKACGGDIIKTAEILDGCEYTDDSLTRQIGENLTLTLTRAGDGKLIRGKITVTADGGEIYSLDAYAIAASEGGQ